MDEAIRLNPNYAAAFLSRGLAYGSKGQYDGAIENFDQAIRLNPNLAAAFFNPGTSSTWSRANLTAPFQDYDEAIQLNPNYAAALDNRC